MRNKVEEEEAHNRDVCSEECANILKDFEVYDGDLKWCAYCNSILETIKPNDHPSGPLFCSRDCEVYFHDAKLCEQCNKQMEQPINNKWCSSKCEEAFYHDLAIERQEKYVEDRRQDEIDYEYDSS